MLYWHGAMAPERRAVIDVGTNSVKLLVAEVTEQTVVPVFEANEQTRLGRGFYETHRLQPEAIRLTAEAVARFGRRASDHAAGFVRVIATSAARDAVNAQELITAIRGHAGLDVEVISGEQEAEWAFRGVATDPQLHEHRLLLLEVGGGSTQVIIGERGHHSFRQSFSLGSVRLLERLQPADPPCPADLAGCREFLRQFFNREVAPVIESTLTALRSADFKLVGSGGTTTILARMEMEMTGFDREKIERTRLNRDRVSHWMARLWSLPLAARRHIPGLPPNRADVILMGAAIFEAVMDHFRADELHVSTRGLRFGAVMNTQ